MIGEPNDASKGNRVKVFSRSWGMANELKVVSCSQHERKNHHQLLIIRPLSSQLLYDEEFSTKGEKRCTSVWDYLDYTVCSRLEVSIGNVDWEKRNKKEKINKSKVRTERKFLELLYYLNQSFCPFNFSCENFMVKRHSFDIILSYLVYKIQDIRTLQW